MFASVMTAAIFGMEVQPVQVEADVSDGLPSLLMVGFATAQVKEALDRVRTALKNHGLSLPPKRITVNLAPVDIRKAGAGFDLPVAASILAASGYLSPALLTGVMMAGELSLSGEVHSVPGILPVVIKARELGCRCCLVPWDNLEEGRLVRDISIVGIRNLEELLKYLHHPEDYKEEPSSNRSTSTTTVDRDAPAPSEVDFREIHGQEGAKRAAEIAAAGFHNLLLVGPPGAGKTMLARRIPTILPALTFEESLELTKIYSIAGLLREGDPLVRHRAFRNPHHTCSPQALAGGGIVPKPGEITLAHNSVLFLDELPEFPRRCLETLRQPLEDRELVISRASGTYRFPADFMLVAAMNPCPCGYYPDMNRCRCTPSDVNRYLGKISQPLLDRIDLCVDIPAVTLQDLTRPAKAECSSEIRRRVEAARARQVVRYQHLGITFNSQLSSGGIAKFCPLTKEGQDMVSLAFDKMQFSARAYHRILKVARTIADLAGSELIEKDHLTEALTYRMIDRKYWG